MKKRQVFTAPLGAKLECLRALQVQLARQTGGRQAWEAAAAAARAAGGDPCNLSDLKVGVELASR